MRKPYFPPVPGGPAPLRMMVERQVRFEEVDPLGIVWHGRYASYFEDARVALGNALRIGYLDFFRHGLAIPIKQFHADYAVPLRYPQTVTIEAVLHYSEAMRLNHEFIIRDEAAVICTTGYTVQLVLDAQGTLQLTTPPLYGQFLQRWREGGVPQP